MDGLGREDHSYHPAVARLRRDVAYRVQVVVPPQHEVAGVDGYVGTELEVFPLIVPERESAPLVVPAFRGQVEVACRRFGSKFSPSQSWWGRTTVSPPRVTTTR